jgi:predicted HTH transcriptional regulator
MDLQELKNTIESGESEMMGFKTSFNERYGSGIVRIRRICKEYGIKEPIFEEWMQGFRVVLFKVEVSKIKNDLGNDIEKMLSEREKNILEEIKQNLRITQNQLS